MRKIGIGIINEEGKLWDFCDTSNLYITNTCFKQPNR